MAMIFTLRIEIDGLCAFVPNKERNRMKVLLVNGLTAAPMDGYDRVPYHYPALRIKNVNLDPDHSTSPDLTLQNYSRLYFIAWEDIDICPHHDWTSAYLHIQNGRRPGSAEPTGGKEEKDFSWVVEAAQLTPDAETEPSLLLPSPPRNLLIGRLALDHGTIESAGVAKTTGSGRNQIFEFSRSKTMQPLPFAQAMATGVVYLLPIEGDYVDLKLIRFGDRHVQGRTRRLRLKPGGSGTVTVKLRNIPLETQVGLPPFSGSALDHFMMLYRTLKRIPDDPPMPRPLYEPWVAAGPATGATTICTGHTLPGV